MSPNKGWVERGVCMFFKVSRHNFSVKVVNSNCFSFRASLHLYQTGLPKCIHVQLFQEKLSYQAQKRTQQGRKVL